MSAFLLILPSANDDINKGPTWVHEMKTPTTARELTKAVKALAVKYLIDDFEAEFNDLARAFGASDDSLKRDEFNPLLLFEEGRKEDYKQFMKSLEDLDRKYHFQDFHDQCVYLRNAFDRERKSNLYDNVLIQCSPVMFFFPEELADQFFEDWLEGVMMQEKSVLLEYENLDGDTIRLVVTHKEDELTEDYVDCRPINRYVGDMPYDAFLVRYFWNEEQGWVPVPIHLIKTYAVNH